MTKHEYDPARGRLPRVLMQASRALRVRCDEVLTDCGLTQAQFEVMQLIDHVGDITAAEIARTLRVTAQSILPVMYRLERAGFVSRSWTPGSGNRLSVEITTDGLAALRQAEGRMRVLDKSIRDALGPEMTSSLVEELFALGNFLSAAE